MDGASATTIALLLCEFAVQAAVAILVLLRPPRRQSSALAWILLIFMVPVLGVLAFLLFGDVRIGRTRRRRHQEIVDRIRRTMRDRWVDSASPELPDRLTPLVGLGQRVADTDPRNGNDVRLITSSEEFAHALIGDLDTAQHHCHLLYYIYLADSIGQRVADALLRATQRGVTCRVLVDAVGSSAFLNSRLRHELERGGVHIVAMLPTRFRFSGARVDVRNHRKIAVIDGHTGYTGSHNVADSAFAPKPKFAPWVDATVRVSGPAVRDLHELFVEDWYMDTDESLERVLNAAPPTQDNGIVLHVMGTGPSSRNDALVHLVQAAFHMAREELILTKPYFVPDEGTMDAMTTAAMRGVRTTLVVPQRNDSRLVGAASRSYYEPLLASGVHIFEYTRGLLHAKTITVDRSTALVTTANLDRRSFQLNFEVSLAIYDSDFASQIRFLQRSYVRDSVEISPRLWARRGRLKRIGENAAGMLAPIL